mgnify:CR=1 FL=1
MKDLITPETVILVGVALACISILSAWVDGKLFDLCVEINDYEIPDSGPAPVLVPAPAQTEAPQREESPLGDEDWGDDIGDDLFYTGGGQS